MEKGARLDIEMNVLILDPFHTGSHAHWSKGMQHFMDATPDVTCELWTLPGRHWKWRMHGACGSFAQKAHEQTAIPDAILTTDMLDVAGLRGLLPIAWRAVPIVLYFHENQLTFPWSPGDREKARGLHHTYEFINVQSAVAADWIWFNSEFHRRVFCKAASQFLRKMPDETTMYRPESWVDKSDILPVGISEMTRPAEWRTVDSPPVILWNHRWEYDKGPDRFWQMLLTLEDAGYDFRLILCGARYKDAPHAQAQIEEHFAGKIIHNGYAASRADYLALLQQSDFALHAPLQEYFGISIAEAMSCGVVPLVKSDHAYTSWMPEGFHFRDSSDFLSKWKSLLAKGPAARDLAFSTVEPFFWPTIAAQGLKTLHWLINRRSA